MKKTLLILSAVFLSGFSFSQVIMSENFDAALTLPAGWAQYNQDGLTPATNVNYMGTNGWIIRANSETGAGNHAVSTSWYTPAGVSNDWLVSPQVAIPASGTIALRFDAMAPDVDYLDGFKVYVSTTGNTPADFVGAPILTQPAAANTYTTYSASLAAYAGQNIYVAIQNYSNDMFLLFVDNFTVLQLVPDDANLLSSTLTRYSQVSTNNTLSMSVKNDGSNTITSLTVNWNDGIDHSSAIAVNIASGATANVSHPTAVNYATALEKNIAITITNVNGNVDPNMTNNADSKLFNTVSQLASKSVVLEEGTGTWCGWCPRGAVAMDYMVATYPTDFIGIAVHNGDPMTVTAYDAAADFGGYPSCNVDRVLLDQTVSQTAFVSYYNARTNLIVPAAISAVNSGTGSNVVIDVSATFYTPFAAADYRLGVIMVEDDVTGTTSGYNQVNYYEGGANGAMGGYESLPDPVPAAQMVYNHVGRALLGGYAGQSGSVPAAITDGQVVSYTFNYTVPATSQAPYMSAVAVLIDNATGEIVNAAKVDMSGANVSEIETIGMEVYPNPAVNVVNVKFEANGGEYTLSITDLAGRVVATTVVSNASGMQNVVLPVEELVSGNYLITVAKEGASFTQNLIVK